jgi:hypothetical protein
MQILKTDFRIQDMERLALEYSIDATVLVQARQTLEETLWLLQICRESDCQQASLVGSL